jgi:hypothetical protein
MSGAQFDMFAEEAVETEPAPVEPIARALTQAIAALPEVLRPRCEPARPVPAGGPELDAWTRETQRIYLLYLVGAIQCLRYRESSIANVRYVLGKLNGLGGEW